MIAERLPIKAANIIILGSRLVSRYAAEAGVISIAITRATPTACIDTTMTTANKTNNKFCKKTTGNLSVAASTGSNDRTRNSL